MRLSELYRTTHVPPDGSDASDFLWYNSADLRRNDMISQISATYVWTRPPRETNFLNLFSESS